MASCSQCGGLGGRWGNEASERYSKEGQGQTQRPQHAEAVTRGLVPQPGENAPTKTSNNKGTEKGLIFSRKHNVIFIPLSVTY